MGAQQSHATEQPADSPGEATDTATKLYKLQDGQGFALEAANADPHFYDLNEDSSGTPARWYLEVGDVETEVTDNSNFDVRTRRVTFVAQDGIWALRFGTVGAYDKFVTQYNSHLFENTYGLDNDEANRTKVFGKDSFVTLGKESDDSRKQWAADMDTDDTREEEEAYKTPSKQGREKDPIRGVRLGASDRSYLLHDNKISVLRNVHGGVQDTGLSFDSPQTSKAKTGAKDANLTPARLLLMHRERQMNMLSPHDGSSVHQMDIETGKTVAEWSFKKDGVDVAMRDLINDTKGAQLDDRDTFLGVGTNRLVRWDQRAAQGVVQEMSSPTVSYAGGKDYARGTNFSCMATSGDGYVVVGSEDGKVRLYSSNTLTMAKTAIPGLGAPITSVDVTYDGKWVLATTDKYVMVVKTMFRDKNGRETNGFLGRMGQAAPAPRLLRLKPEDQAKVGRQKLSKGKFTWITEAGRSERWIVSSCGSYTVLWNFRQVKLADSSVQSYGGLTTCTDYHLIRKDESVVDSVFMHDKYASPGAAGDESAMVVFTEHRVWSLADDDDA